MKAIQIREFGGPEVMQLAEVPVPSAGAGQVLVEIRAAGVNPVETYIRAGTYPSLPALPYTPGNDGAGIVRETGPDVTAFQPGDRVFLSGSVTGTYAEKALCGVADVHPLPETATFAEGAAIGIPYATAYRALFQRGRVEAGETVLVHGASGGVGTAAVQLARTAGARVFGTAGSPEGRDLVLRLGAEQVFDHNDPGCADAILAATGGVDCILEMLANTNLDGDLRLLAQCGRVVVIGSRGRIEIDPRDAMMRDADIRGMVMNKTPAGERAAIYRALSERLEKGTIHPVIEKEFPLADAPEAHRSVLSHRAHGKIVLVP